MKTDNFEHNELELNINPTEQTPLIRYSVENSTLEIIGRSIPEDVIGFYRPVMGWLKNLASTNPSRLDVEFLLEYFNTNSSRALLDILKTIERLKDSGTMVHITWYHEEIDDDMREFGNDLSELINLPLKILALNEASFDERTDSSKHF
ncbi:MAG: DUF1987 domain-containing protein [Flavobacteriales bacterium]|nr:DUF1987 domain-containing protein [Flavobacteriales bacterium]